MWAFIARKLLYNIPVYLSIILLMMGRLRVRDPVYSYLGKNATEEQMETLRHNMGLDDPFFVQYARFMGQVATFDFSEFSWSQKGRTVGDIIIDAIPPSLSITVP